MAEFEHKTIRDSLLGMVMDHLMKGGITCGITSQVGCELLALLSAYREEDRRLYPEVYLLGASEVDLLNVLFPGSPRYTIGRIPIGPDLVTVSRLVAAKSLNTCASLAIDGWSIFVRREETMFGYGLVRSAAEPYSGSVDDTLASSTSPAALFRNSAVNTVEIINGTGGRLEISLTTAPPSISSLSGQIAAFSRVACEDANAETRDQVAAYFTRVLTEALRSSHGTLLAIIPASAAALPVGFSDGIVLPEPIPLAQATSNTIRDKSGEAVSLLRSYEALLRGMIMSDGITILATDGSIRAFRVFVSGGVEQRPNQQAGGSRNRAFGILRQHLGFPFRAALFRSQDGRTEVVVQL